MIFIYKEITGDSKPAKGENMEGFPIYGTDCIHKPESGFFVFEKE